MQYALLVQLVQSHCGLESDGKYGLRVTLQSGSGDIALRKIFQKFIVGAVVDSIHEVTFPGKLIQKREHFEIRLMPLAIKLQGIAPA